MYSADADEKLHKLLEAYEVVADNLRDAKANSPLWSLDRHEREDAKRYVKRWEAAFQRVAEDLFAHIEKQVNRT